MAELEFNEITREELQDLIQGLTQRYPRIREIYDESPCKCCFGTALHDEYSGDSYRDATDYQSWLFLLGED